MRRKPGLLVPVEEAILAAALDRRRPRDEFYGFAIAKLIADRAGDDGLPSHGALYKALNRMARAGLLEAWWEDPHVAEGAGRPRRRLYRVTSAGVKALAASRRARGEQGGAALRPRLADQ